MFGEIMPRDNVPEGCSFITLKCAVAGIKLQEPSHHNHNLCSYQSTLSLIISLPLEASYYKLVYFS